MEQLVVQVTEEVAAAIRARTASAQLDELRTTAGFRLDPQHPGTTDRELSSFLSAEVPDRAAGLRAADRLLSLPAVRAAYVAPTPTLA